MFRCDDIYESNHIHTQGTCQTALLWPQQSPASLRVSQLSVGFSFSSLTFSQWILKLQCSPASHIHFLCLLMDFGGNIRGMESWVQSANLCPLHPCALYGLQGNCVGVYWGLFLAEHPTVCWTVMRCAEWPVCADQQILEHSREHDHSTLLTTQGHDFPKNSKRSMGQGRRVFIIWKAFKQACFPHLHREPSLAALSILSDLDVDLCLLARSCFSMKAELRIYQEQILWFCSQM